MVCSWTTCGGAAWAAGAATSRATSRLSAAVVSRRDSGRSDTVPPFNRCSACCRAPVIVWLLAGWSARAPQPPKGYGEAAAGGQGLWSCRQQHKASLRSLPIPSSLRHRAGLARRQASVRPRAETSEVASVRGCGWPQFLSLHRGAARGRGSSQPHPCEAQGQGRRDPAGGGQDRQRADRQDGRALPEELSAEPASPAADGPPAGLYATKRGEQLRSFAVW